MAPHLSGAKAPESKRKFMFRYGICSTKATYVEKGHLLPGEEIPDRSRHPNNRSEERHSLEPY